MRSWERNRHEPALRNVPLILDFLGYVPFESGTTLGNQLRHARWCLGLSREALARRLGVDKTTVWGWETGRHRPIRKCRERIEVLLASPT